MKPNSIMPMVSWKLGHDGTHLCTVAVRDASGRNCKKEHLVIKEGYISVFACSHALSMPLINLTDRGMGREEDK